MKASKKQVGRHIWALIFLLCGNLIFFLTLWLSSKYDKVSLDQFVYQMKTSAAGANRSLMNSAYIRVGACGILLTALIVFLFLLFADLIPKLSHAVFRSEKAKHFQKKIHQSKVFQFIFKHALPIALVIFLLASVFFITKLDFVRYVSNITTESPFIEDNYVDPNSVTISLPEDKRNLIYIFVESLEVTFAETEAGGPISANYMPELSALAEENISFSNDDGLGGALSFSGTTWTAAAMVAQTSGVIVQVPIVADNYGGENPYMPGVVSIGEILEQNGYTNTLLVGSNAQFANRYDYFQDHGNYRIIDTESLKAEGRLPEDYDVWWGFEDQKLFAYAKEELTRLASEDAPFNFTFLTCDTHFPNGYVCEYCQDEYDAQYPNVVHCASRQLTEFVQWVQAQPFYENTTIVLCGDHLTMDPNFMQSVNEEYERTIYNCIINAAASPVNESNRLFGIYDMMPTTLAAMGATIEGDRLGLGTNLFSERKTLTEQYGHAYVDEEFQKRSSFYNKTFLAME